MLKNPNKSIPVKQKKTPTVSNNSLLRRVQKVVVDNALIPANTPIIVGLSGGADSVSLVHLLSTILPEAEIIAVYVNHHLRPSETAAEISLANSISQELDILLKVIDVDVNNFQQNNKVSTEEAARILRYRALQNVARHQSGAVIAVAHTADDQVEELLLRLIRGSGRAGLSGMRLKRDNIIRPLLHEKKSSLLTYLKEQHIRYCHDSSNDDRKYLRNQVRLDLLPYLTSHFNPSISQNLLQLTTILVDEEELLEEMTDSALVELCTLSPAASDAPENTSISFAGASFLRHKKALQRRLLEKLCWRMGSKPSFRQIENLRHLVRDGENGAELHLSCGLRVRRVYNDILFSHPAGRKNIRGSGLTPLTLEVEITGVGSYPFDELGRTLTITRVEQDDIRYGSTLYIDAERVHFPLQVRQTMPGDKFKPLGAPGRKKIGNFFTDKKIDRYQRRFFPLLLCEDKIIAILGIQIDDKYQVATTTRYCLALDWHTTHEGEQR